MLCVLDRAELRLKFDKTREILICNDISFEIPYRLSIDQEVKQKSRMVKSGPAGPAIVA